MLLFLEKATQEILSQGAMVVILAAGMYVMFSYFKKEVSDLKEALIKKDGLVREKDELLERQHRELSNLLKEDARSQTEMTSALNSLTKIIELWVNK